MTVVHHEIAGIRFSVESDGPVDEFSHPGFAPFKTGPVIPDCRIRIHTGEPDTASEDDSGNHDSQVLTRDDGNTLLRIDFPGRVLDVWFRGGMSPQGGYFRFGAFPYSLFLHQFGSVMLHAACADFDGRCALLLAPDEGGKTTAAGLLEGSRILSDDMVILRREDRDFRAWGTPWTTFEPWPSSSEPGGIFLLEKAGCFGLEKAGVSEVFSRLWADHGFLRDAIPREQGRLYFDLCCDVSSSAPAWRLLFPPDRIDSARIRALVSAP
jgi:hypothetical protein